MSMIGQEFWPVALIVAAGFVYLAYFLGCELMRHWRWRRQVKRRGRLVDIDRYSAANRPGTCRDVLGDVEGRVTGGNRRELD